MRKKNKAKSSNDHSDSDYINDSDDEQKKTKNKMSDSDEDFQPIKRRRLNRNAKKTTSADENIDHSDVDNSADTSNENG